MVIDSVTGLRDSMPLHDVEAFGLVDGDARGDCDKDRLKEKGVFALSCYSVESLYFCVDAIKAVAEWQALALGEDPDDMHRQAKDGALAALQKEGVAQMLAARICERRVRNQVELPTWKNILHSETYSVKLDTKTSYQEELDLISGLLASNDLEEILVRYPIRHSEVIDEIVKPLQLSRKNYRKTLLSRIRGDPELADRLRNPIEPLASIILEEN